MAVEKSQCQKNNENTSGSKACKLKPEAEGPEPRLCALALELFAKVWNLLSLKDFNSNDLNVLKHCISQVCVLDLGR